MSYHIKDADDLQNKLKEAGDNLVVIDFHATWCGPCRKIGPKYEEFAGSYPDVMFLKVDVDECEDIAAQYEISVMPTFIFVKNGKKIEAFSGGNEDKLKEVICQLK
ncbi:unnamed protein product [Nezara viridula]|uniref:Thioredoxin n=1 Tax=Nezara viridula TaxID=85310 RepID=A0A9P0ECL2_NEZVI|nr:unnamed protein product [Nezara viridula]